MEETEYFTKYNWHGYENTGSGICQYISTNIEDVKKFIDDDEFRHDVVKDDNGFLISMLDYKIYKRTVIEEEIDYKVVVRDNKINKIIN